MRKLIRYINQRPAIPPPRLWVRVLALAGNIGSIAVAELRRREMDELKKRVTALETHNRSPRWTAAQAQE